MARWAARCGVPAFSGDHDDLDADRVIGALCPRIPGRGSGLPLLLLDVPPLPEGSGGTSVAGQGCAPLLARS